MIIFSCGLFGDFSSNGSILSFGIMIFVVPRELIICVEPVEFDDGKLPGPESGIAINQPAGEEFEIDRTSIVDALVEASVFKISESSGLGFSGF